jgi:integrase
MNRSERVLVGIASLRPAGSGSTGDTPAVNRLTLTPYSNSGLSGPIRMTPEDIAAMADRYHAMDFPGRRYSTVKMSQMFLSSWVRWMKNRRMNEVTYENLQKYVAYIYDRYAPASAVKKWGFVIRFLRWLVRCGAASSIPHEMVRMPIVRDQSAPQIITADEYAKLRAAAAGHWMDWIILLGWNTGMSVSDCMMLKWGNVDMEKCVISIKRIKTGAQSIIPFSPTSELGRGLASMREANPNAGPDDWVSVDAGDRLRHDRHYASAAHAAYREISKRAGVNKRFHCMRHAFVSALANSGMNMVLASKVSGHADPRVLSKYTHPDLDAIRSAVTKAMDDGRAHVEVHLEDPPGGKAHGRSFMFRPNSIYIAKRGRICLPDGAPVQFVRTGNDAEGKLAVVTPCSSIGEPESELQLVVDIRDVNRFR